MTQAAAVQLLLALAKSENLCQMQCLWHYCACAQSQRSRDSLSGTTESDGQSCPRGQALLLILRDFYGAMGEDNPPSNSGCVVEASSRCRVWSGATRTVVLRLERVAAAGVVMHHADVACLRAIVSKHQHRPASQL